MIVSVRKQHVIALLLFLIVSIVLLFPVLRKPFSTMYDDYDGVFITWTMRWAMYALGHDPTKIFNAPIFYPLTATYTFSDPMITSAVIGWPFAALTGEPVMLSTINLFFALAGTAFFTYLCAYQLTKRWLPSILAGAIASFSATHLQYLPHLHTLMIQFIPLGLYAWLKFVETQKKRWVVLTAGCFLLQAFNAPFTAYVFIASFGMFLFDKQTWSTIKKYWKFLSVTTVVMCSLSAIVYLPYFMASRFYHSQRTIRDAAHFALSIEELTHPDRISLVAVVMVCLLLYIIKKRMKKSPLFYGTLFMCFIGIMLALGPVLTAYGKTVKIPFPIPLPYALAYYLVPGFNAFRTPSRWLSLVNIILALMAAQTLTKFRKKTILGISALCFLVLVLEAPRFLTTVHVPSTSAYPPVYHWLAAQQFHAIAFMPSYIYSMGALGKQEPARMFYTIGTNNPVPMYNGYSGYAPRQRVDELAQMHDQFPQSWTLNRLKTLGVNAVVIEVNRLSLEQQQMVQRLPNHILYEDAAAKVIQL